MLVQGIQKCSLPLTQNSLKLYETEKKSTLKTQDYSGMRLIILVTLTGIRLSRS